LDATRGEPGIRPESAVRLASLAQSDIYVRIYRRLCRTDEESRVSFDAQCDLAAVVYGADDDPDRLISGFAADLRRSGGRPVGVVQLGRSCRAENPRLGVVMLPDGDVVRLAPRDFAPRDFVPRDFASQDFASQDLAPRDFASRAEAHVTGCRLDPDRLAGLATRLAAAIEAGADLVIINRFGRSEAAGKGLIELIPQALDADIPVLIAVPEQRFAAWIRFSEGMNVRLACRREALDRWWQAVTGPSRPRSGAGTFCEFVK
jgi:Protein of unknown function (DUF2478)